MQASMEVSIDNLHENDAMTVMSRSDDTAALRRRTTSTTRTTAATATPTPTTCRCSQASSEHPLGSSDYLSASAARAEHC